MEVLGAILVITGVVLTTTSWAWTFSITRRLNALTMQSEREKAVRERFRALLVSYPAAFCIGLGVILLAWNHIMKK